MQGFAAAFAGLWACDMLRSIFTHEKSTSIVVASTTAACLPVCLSVCLRSLVNLDQEHRPDLTFPL